MMRSFEVSRGVELVESHDVFDLHNAYDFVGLHIESGPSVSLRFLPRPPLGGGCKQLLLRIEGVTFLEISPLFAGQLEKFVEEVGFKAPGDVDDDWLGTEAQAQDTDHLFIRFNNDQFVRVGASAAYLTKSEEGTSDVD